MKTVRDFRLEFVGFCGFYDSIFSDYIENSLNMDLENLHDSLSKLKINEFNCWQEMDYKQYMLDVADYIMDEYIDDLKGYLGRIIKLVDIDGSVSFDSPKYYNFETDKVYKTVAISEGGYKKLVEFVRDNSYVSTIFFQNHFTDYDGFHSYYSNKLDDWTSLHFSHVTSLQVSYLIRCAFLICLYNDVQWRYNTNGDEVNDVRELERNYVRSVEEVVYDDMDMGYSEYVNWGMYQKELKNALDREKVVVDEFGATVINDTLWPLVDDWKINEHNELVLK